MRLIINNMSGKTRTIDVEPNTLIMDVKQLLFEAEWFMLRSQRLFYNGKHL